MRIHLPSGIEMEIIRHENGLIEVNCTSAPRTYNSVEEFLQGRYNDIVEILTTAKNEGIFSGTYNISHITAPPVLGTEGGSKPVQKKQIPVKNRQIAKKAKAVAKVKAKVKSNQTVKSKGTEEHVLTDTTIREIIAISLAEADVNDRKEQAKKIFWVYYNLYKKFGESGFKKSAAYNAKGKKISLYSLFMTMLGAKGYANEMYDAKHTFGQFAKGAVAQQGDKAAVDAAKEYIDTQLKDADKNNPYPTYVNNGNADDINLMSSGAKKAPKMWNEVRTYYKLQLDKKVLENYVINIGEKAHSTFLFDLKAIENYLKQHPMDIAKTPMFNKGTGNFTLDTTMSAPSKIMPKKKE